MADEVAAKREHKSSNEKIPSGAFIKKHKWWLVGGLALGLVVFVFMKKKQSANAASTAANQNTGQGAVDPATGIPYATELAQAQQAASAGGASAPASGGNGSSGASDGGTGVTGTPSTAIPSTPSTGTTQPPTATAPAPSPPVPPAKKPPPKTHNPVTPHPPKKRIGHPVAPKPIHATLVSPYIRTIAPGVHYAGGTLA